MDDWSASPTSLRWHAKITQCNYSRNVCDSHRPLPAELVGKASEYQGTEDGTNGGTGGDDFLLLGVEYMAEVRPYHWQGRPNDGGIIAKEESGNGSDGDEEYEVWCDLVFILGSYQVLVLERTIYRQSKPTTSQSGLLRWGVILLTISVPDWTGLVTAFSMCDETLMSFVSFPSMLG